MCFRIELTVEGLAVPRWAYILKSKNMQLDVVQRGATTIICNLYTENRCVKVVMSRSDYEALVRDGFFIRSGEEQDSAGVWNTTLNYGTK
jgi:hypothetical protein